MQEDKIEQLSKHGFVSFAFGPFVLVPQRQLLLKDGFPVRVGGRALSILTALVERPGAVISKRELLEAAWPDVHIEEDNLKVNIAGLRRVLGQTAEIQQYIVAVSGRGYQFVEPVRSLGNRQPPAEAPLPPAPRNNLPNSSRLIFGRAAVIEAVCADLQRARLVSILGPGGVGKTTVGLAAAEQLLGSFRDGVWFVDLGALTDARLVSSAIAQSVGMAAQSSNTLAALCVFMRAREALIVLDNCEHLVEAVASCANRILSNCPEVRILATSRETLSLPIERVRRLHGLETPATKPQLAADEAVGFPAIRLFVERATERLESFVLTDANAGTVAEICRRLDGLALAIELAATRVDAFGLSELLGQVNAQVSSLKGYRADPERHLTLEAAMDWSYDLLSNREQLVLCRLATFAGDFGFDSACAVAVGPMLDRATVIESLANLVAKSLIMVEAGELQLRYSLLNTTRTYALSKLAADDELDTARRRHAEHSLELAQKADVDKHNPSFEEWLSRHGSLISDIRVALQFATMSSSSAALAVKLTVAAVPFWKRLSMLEEGRTAAERALGDVFASHRDKYDDLILNLALGAMELHTLGPLPQVKVRLTTALEAAEGLGDKELQLECLRAISEYFLWTSDSRAAIEASRKIRAIGLEGIATAEGDSDAQTGAALRWIGELDRSRQHLESVVNRPLSNHRRSEAGGFEFNQRLIALGSLAQVLWLQGFPDSAVRLAQEQREQAETTNHAVSICSALIQSTAIALFVGDLAGADRHLTRLDDHAAEHGLWVWRSMGRCHRGRWLYDSGKPVDLVVFRHSLVELHDAGFRMRYPAYLAHFSLGQAQHGDFEGALSSIDEVIERCKSNGHSWGIPEALRLKATYLMGSHQTTRASLDLLRLSLDMAREQGTLSWELRSAITLVETSSGDDEYNAREALSDAYGRFSEGLSTVDLIRARGVLGKHEQHTQNV